MICLIRPIQFAALFTTFEEHICYTSSVRQVVTPGSWSATRPLPAFVVILVVYMHKHIYIYTYMHTCICVYVCICVYIYIYICIMCMHIYIYIYIYIYITQGAQAPPRLRGEHLPGGRQVVMEDLAHTLCVCLYIRHVVIVSLCLLSCCYLSLYLHIYIYIPMNIHSYISIYVYMHIHICIHTHIIMLLLLLVLFLRTTRISATVAPLESRTRKPALASDYY